MKEKEETLFTLFDKKNKSDYSPLKYPGGKSKAVKKILNYIPKDIKKMVSPFMGGGSIEIAVSNKYNIPVYAYDIFDILVNYWQHQLRCPEDLANELSKLHPNKEEYSRVKELIKEHWNKNTGYDGKMNPLELATYYYYNMQLSYGPGFLGWPSSIYMGNQKKYDSTIDRVRNFYAPNLNVNCGSFENVIPENNDCFMYLDPPYYLGGDSKMFAGIYPMRNFPIHHDGFNHQLLCDLMKEHRGGFVMSYNDCSWIREAYKDFQIVEVEWNYSMGNGETRVGKNRSNRDYDKNNIKHSHEVLIIGK